MGGASCDLESNCLRRTPFHRLHISFPVYASSSCDFSSQYLSWNCQGKECIGKVFFWGHPHPVPDVAVPCDVWRWKEKQIFFHICHNLFLKKKYYKLAVCKIIFQIIFIFCMNWQFGKQIDCLQQGAASLTTCIKIMKMKRNTLSLWCNGLPSFSFPSTLSLINAFGLIFLEVGPNRRGLDSKIDSKSSHTYFIFIPTEPKGNGTTLYCC